jgi:hypothetical protein
MPAAGEARFYYNVVCPYSYLESPWSAGGGVAGATFGD